MAPPAPLRPRRPLRPYRAPVPSVEPCAVRPGVRQPPAVPAGDGRNHRPARHGHRRMAERNLRSCPDCLHPLLEASLRTNVSTAVVAEVACAPLPRLPLAEVHPQPAGRRRWSCAAEEAAAMPVAKQVPMRILLPPCPRRERPPWAHGPWACVAPMVPAAPPGGRLPARLCRQHPRARLQPVPDHGRPRWMERLPPPVARRRAAPCRPEDRAASSPLPRRPASGRVSRASLRPWRIPPHVREPFCRYRYGHSSAPALPPTFPRPAARPVCAGRWPDNSGWRAKRRDVSVSSRDSRQ